MGRPAGAWVTRWLNAWTGVGRWVVGSGGRASGSFAFRYLKKKALPLYNIALESAQTALNRLEGKGGGVSPLVFQGAAVHNELSEERYGWMDVFGAHTPAPDAVPRSACSSLQAARQFRAGQAGWHVPTDTRQLSIAATNTPWSIHPSIRHPMTSALPLLHPTHPCRCIW